jgi:sec-independent protein translocase protein TatB
MFNLSGSEMVFLLLLALIILGPEKLPDAVRRFGKGYAEFKKMSVGFQSELKSALDEPMREMRETADAFKNAVNFDFDADDASPADEATTDDAEATTDDAEATTDDAEATTDDAETTEPAESQLEVAEPATEPAAAGNEPPLVRPPGPTFHSAAPQQPKVAPAVEETASE